MERTMRLISSLLDKSINLQHIGVQLSIYYLSQLGLIFTLNNINDTYNFQLLIKMYLIIVLFLWLSTELAFISFLPIFFSLVNKQNLTWFGSQYASYCGQQSPHHLYSLANDSSSYINLALLEQPLTAQKCTILTQFRITVLYGYRIGCTPTKKIQHKNEVSIDTFTSQNLDSNFELECSVLTSLYQINCVIALHCN